MCGTISHFWEIAGIGATLLGEGGVVFAILYESRSSRLADFFSEAHAGPYDGRGELYSAYAALEAPTLAERAAQFRKKLSADPKLRAEADRQIAFFARFQFTLRRSIFFWQRGLLARLYPHVLIRLWIMLHERIREFVPHGEWERLFMRAVEDSFREVAKRSGDSRVESITSADGAHVVPVTNADLEVARQVLMRSLSE
jgi:hypothetical protein